jgi:hypothetical protein
MLPAPNTHEGDEGWQCTHCSADDAWVDMPDDTVVCSNCFTTHTMPAGWYEHEED